MFIVDRLKDMIIIGQEKVYCREVEAVIYQLATIREVAVFGMPDPNGGELVAACVVLLPGASLSEQELLRHCRQSLADFKVPRQVEFRKTDLPRTASGDVQKRTLRKHFRHGGNWDVE